LFSKLKDSDGKVDVQVLMSNITGSVQDTVDYKNHMFKQLYDVIFKNGNQEKFQKDLELHDKSSNGKISPQDMMACLKKISGSKFTDESIQKFVRQLNKDSLF
jgi:Ca2+-binding EF-hand superfamily protein